MLSLGVIGEYVGRIYDESRAAPEVHHRVSSRVGRLRLDGQLGARGGPAAGVHPRRRAGHAPGRARARDAEAAARGGGRAVPRPPTAAARPSYGAREVVLCVGYRGEQIESRIGAQRFGDHDPATASTIPGSTARSGRCVARCRCSASAFWCSTATPIFESTTRAVARTWRESEPAGGDERAPQRRSLGCLQRCLRRRARAGLMTSVRPARTCTGSTMGWGA